MTFDLDIFIQPLNAMLEKISTFVPVLFGALVIFVVGWIIARVIRFVVDKFLGTIRFDIIAEKGGLTKILTQGGIKITARQVLSGLVYWLVIIMVLVMTVDALGLEAAPKLLENILGYLPSVIAAIFVLVIGMFLGVVISGVVSTTAGNAHIPQPQLLGSISKYSIIVFAVMIAVKQLGIETTLIDNIVIILIGAVSLALAIAFGVGGRDLAAKYLEDLFKKKSS